MCSQIEGYSCGSGIFDCSSILSGDKFQCGEFDCAHPGSYDFMCDRVVAGGKGFQCYDASGGDFVCNNIHIFKCYTLFACPTGHKCRGVKQSCSPPHPEQWEPPPEDRDDGYAGDFDCSKFTCAASQPGNPGEKFDCEVGSDFKCLDRGGGTFNCGELSEFECGEEDERFVCMNYGCTGGFQCESAFHCGNKDRDERYTCNPNDFACLPLPVPEPGDGFACGVDQQHEVPFTCERYMCDQEGYGCNPPNQFACPELITPPLP